MKLRMFTITLFFAFSHYNYSMQMMIQMSDHETLKQRLLDNGIDCFSQYTNIIEQVADKTIPISDLINIVDRELNKHFEDLKKDSQLRTHPRFNLRGKKSSLIATLYANHPSAFLFGQLDQTS